MIARCAVTPPTRLLARGCLSAPACRLLHDLNPFALDHIQQRQRCAGRLFGAALQPRHVADREIEVIREIGLAAN